jgi:hypothetical protein
MYGVWRFSNVLLGESYGWRGNRSVDGTMGRAYLHLLRWAWGNIVIDNSQKFINPINANVCDSIRATDHMHSLPHNRIITTEGKLRIPVRSLLSPISVHSRAEETERPVGQKGGRAFLNQADVPKAEHVSNLIKTTQSKYGTIDVLVDDAGRCLFRDFLDMPVET